GAVLIDYDSSRSLDQLIGKADKAMYDHKRGKKQWSNSIVDAGLTRIRHRHVSQDFVLPFNAI
ncbi:MAG TPA: hypothetical protein DHU55_05175, partial [Blastocatellia bacterium]|nr:hypothetical protein [Blastocatellia bacterium]